MVDPTQRRILSAETLSIGSELTVGDTRDTNAGEIARALAGMGVAVGRLTALPDRLEDVRDAFMAGLTRADLIVSTGGLGPTPDDLTREAIAAVCGETPGVDPDLEAWLRDLWKRRGMPFPELNLKQAWRIPSAEPLPNPNGTAPGWFVERPDGRIIVALPGPPREMRPMWADEAVPRLRQRGIGADTVSRTYRLTGIGESQLADQLGDALLRTTNPEVATYARVEAVDVRISAIGDGTTTAESLVQGASEVVLDRVGDYVWAMGETTWAEAIGERLATLGWTLSVVEIGTGGQVAALLGDREWLRTSEALTPDAPAAAAHGSLDTDTEVEDETPSEGLARFARRAREHGGSEVGMAVKATPRHGDTAVSIAIVSPTGERHKRRLVFLGGAHGRSRAALAAAAVLLEALRSP